MPTSLRWAVSASLAPYPKLHRFVQRLYNAPARTLVNLRPSEQGLLADMARRWASVFFVQVGAHDGKTEDYLYDIVRRHGWRGILIEPVRSVFERLRENYRGVPGLVFENVALADEDGTRPFWRIRDEPGLPAIASALGSFDRNVLLRKNYLMPDFESYIIEETVACLSFRSLVARHAVEKIDVMVIDTEGYDLAVLRQIDLARHRPEIVIYEQTNLAAPERKAAVKLLQEAGYRVARVGIGWNNAAIRRP